MKNLEVIANLTTRFLADDLFAVFIFMGFQVLVDMVLTQSG